ncbi:MAG: C39 family peptidase [bacterium]
MVKSIRRRKIFLILSGAVLILGLAAGLVYWKWQPISILYTEVAAPKPPEAEEFVPEPEESELAVSLPAPAPVPSPAPTPAPAPAPSPEANQILPQEFNLAVPFALQAPLGTWDSLHNETCEEAAVLMVDLYYRNKQASPEEVERELLRIVEVERRLFGFFEDTNVQQTSIFALAAFSFSKSVVLENPTELDLKREIFSKRPVILPANGKLLKNPNFRNGGPPYHMVVLKGWNEKGFFTNDPGTKKGENYFYTYDVIMRAMGDYDGAQGSGPKRVLVLYP